MPTSDSTSANKVILAIEALGFVAVLVVLWLDEFADIPHRYFGAAETPLRPQEFWFEAIAVILLGAVVLGATFSFLRRIRRLEQFLPVCAWCRTVLVADRWVTFETYMRDHHDVKSTHGICPACHIALRPASTATAVEAAEHAIR